MTTLAEFLDARLAEDEATALAAEARGRWVAGDEGIYETDGGCIATGPYGCGIGCEADHIARHDPSRVLREVEAKRRILSGHVPEAFGGNTLPTGKVLCLSCATLNRHEQWTGRSYPCSTVLALATVWSDHPDYRTEWNPS